MLVLSRKAGQIIQIGSDITVEVRRIRGGRVALGVTAPQDVFIRRGELDPFETEAQVPANPPRKSGTAPPPTDAWKSCVVLAPTDISSTLPRR